MVTPVVHCAPLLVLENEILGKKEESAHHDDYY
jgi:hypothetical protein